MLSCKYDKNNPARPVDWRWQQAAYRRCDDSWVSRAIDYQDARQACRTEPELEELDGQYPGFVAAFDVWSAGRSLRKATLEAAILAKESDTKVGERLGLSPQTVEVYEALFFNVRDRLPCTGYIMAQVFGTKVYFGLSGEDFDLIMKMLAYHCGPGMIDLVLELYSTELHVNGEDEAGPESEEVTASNIPVKIMLLSMMGGYTLEALGQMLSVKLMEAQWKSGEITTREFDEWLDELLADFKEAITAKPEQRPLGCLPGRQEVRGEVHRQDVGVNLLHDLVEDEYYP